MKKARITAGLVLLILLASLIQWPQAKAIIPQDQTIWITDTHDDLFITETGIGIDSQLCHITDPNMDIRSFLVFRKLNINFWEPLTNATLRFRTTATLDFDANSSVTVYGMRYSDLQREGWLNPGWVLSVPITSAYTDYNTSQFYGQTWHEVDVTAIVEELIRSYDWDGDGADGTETGDAIGFIIYGAEGYDTRWFIDYLYGTPSLATHLVIHWNHEVPPPSGYETAEFVETYGDNYTIWEMAGALGYPLEPIEYVFTNVTEPDSSVYYSNLTDVGPYFVNTSVVTYPTERTTQRKIVRTSNGTLYIAYPQQSFGHGVIKSVDNGSTWILVPDINIQFGPAIAVDSEDIIHVVWYELTTEDLFYSYLNVTWSEPYVVSPYAGFQRDPSIAIDSQDNLHITWVGKYPGTPTKAQVHYINYTDSWSTPYRISDTAWMDDVSSYHCAIAVDSQDNLHVSWEVNSQIFYRNRTTFWEGVEWISPLDGMIQQGYPSIAVNSNDEPYVVWHGDADGFEAPEIQIWVNNASSGWDYPIRVSTYSTMVDYRQRYPNIAFDSDDIIYVIWEGKIFPPGVDDTGWLANYTDTWNEPYQVQVGGELTFFSLRWARWPEAGPSTFLISDENGTVVVEGLDSLEDAEDWIDAYDPDPEDPDPAGEWSTGPGGETGAFTRFRMRLWFMLIGFGCLFGPVLFFAWRRPSGYYLMCGAIVMLIGIGLLISIGQV